MKTERWWNSISYKIQFFLFRKHHTKLHTRIGHACYLDIRELQLTSTNTFIYNNLPEKPLSNKEVLCVPAHIDEMLICYGLCSKLVIICTNNVMRLIYVSYYRQSYVAFSRCCATHPLNTILHKQYNVQR